MELIRNFFNTGGETSFFGYLLFLLAFIIFIFGVFSLADIAVRQLFNNQED